MIYLVVWICLVGVTIIYLFTGKTKPPEKQSTQGSGSKSTTSKQNFIENPELTRKAHRKGELGEFKIDFQLEQLPPDYKYISDVLFRTKRGLTQIDQIIITPVGVFVIETKNYAGKIYGKQFDKMWAQYGNGKKINFYNPIRQNYGHVEAVKELIQNPIAIHSIISFTRRCELKIDLDLRT
ncbi:MAG: nuclease-related domain-containing protein [Carboxydocellales bacterium]